MVPDPAGDRRPLLIAAGIGVLNSIVVTVFVAGPAYLEPGDVNDLVGDPVALLLWIGIGIGLLLLAGIPTYLLDRYQFIGPMIAFVLLEGNFLLRELRGIGAEPLMGFLPLLPVYVIATVVIGGLEYVVRR